MTLKFADHLIKHQITYFNDVGLFRTAFLAGDYKPMPIIYAKEIINSLRNSTGVALLNDEFNHKIIVTTRSASHITKWHEAGHLIHPLSMMDGHTILSELVAWKWAYDNYDENLISKGEFLIQAYGSFSSYLEPNLKNNPCKYVKDSIEMAELFGCVTKIAWFKGRGSTW